MGIEDWVETWSIRKPAVECAGGVVVSHHHLASDIGASVLRAGGNAVDAALAAGFAIGVAEPWMSGIGGIGFMLVYSARDRSVRVVDFNAVSPRALDPAAYPLTGGKGGDLFGWPAVAEDRNIHGYHAMCVPSYVAGAALALERFGTKSWAEVVTPAAELAERGLLVDWYAALKILTAAKELRQYPESARIYLRDGLPPVGEWGGAPPTADLGELPATLRRLAQAGPRDFYEGSIARAIAADLEEGGASLSADDLAACRARIVDPLHLSYRGHRVHAVPGMSGGPSLAQALGDLAGRELGDAPGPDAYLAYAEVLDEAYRRRLAGMGDDEGEAAQSCTTHLGVVDGEGNVVALTQTLLSLFGSRVVLPRTGILVNNSVISFDPSPGKPNSIRPGRRPLSNMCPSILERSDGMVAAAGASGGRRILPAVLQTLSFLADFGMDVDAAVHQPRIDASGGTVVRADRALGPATLAALQARGTVEAVTHGVYPSLFALPNVAAHHGGRAVGGAYVFSPWAKASGASA